MASEVDTLSALVQLQRPPAPRAMLLSRLVVEGIEVVSGGNVSIGLNCLPFHSTANIIIGVLD